MKDMWDILRDSDWHELAADLVVLVLICVDLYLLVVLGGSQ